MFQKLRLRHENAYDLFCQECKTKGLTNVKNRWHALGAQEKSRLQAQAAIRKEEFLKAVEDDKQLAIVKNKKSMLRAEKMISKANKERAQDG